MTNVQVVSPNAGHDHQRCANSAMEVARQLCVTRGVQLTPIRQQVLALIWESHKAVKAYELLDRFKVQQQSAKPATIYRALDFLMEQGLIHRIESLNAFVGCHCSAEQHEQLLLICKSCQEVEERSAELVMRDLAAEIQAANFIVHSKAIEVQGICAKCAASSPKE